jgi:hypothetical protein
MRTKQRLPVNYAVCFSSGNSETWYGEVKDISWGGLFIASSAVQPPGTPLHMQVRIPGVWESMTFDGTVAWSTAGSAKGPGMGVKLDVS